MPSALSGVLTGAFHLLEQDDFPLLSFKQAHYSRDLLDAPGPLDLTATAVKGSSAGTLPRSCPDRLERMEAVVWRGNPTMPHEPYPGSMQSWISATQECFCRESMVSRMYSAPFSTWKRDRTASGHGQGLPPVCCPPPGKAKPRTRQDSGWTRVHSPLLHSALAEG